MQHEVFAVFAFESIDDLLILTGTESGDDQSLGLAAGEQGRAVRTWQDTDFGNDRADGFGVATVDPLTGFEDVTTNDAGFELLEALGNHLWFDRIVFGVESECLFLGFADFCLTLDLVLDLVGSFQIVANGSGELFLDGFCVIGGLWQITRLFRAGFSQLDDCVDDRLETFPTEHDRTEHGGFVKLIGLRLNHQHAFFGAGNNEVESALFQLL